MRHADCVWCVAALVLAASGPAAQDRPKEPQDELRRLFSNAASVFAGKYVKDAKDDPPSKRTTCTFDGCKWFKMRHPNLQLEHEPSSRAETPETFAFGFDGTTRAMEKVERGRRHLVFLGIDGGSLGCVPETAERLALLEDWAKNGVYSKEERAALYEKAGWVVVVTNVKEGCAKSYPCQHSWEFTVADALKGKDVPKSVTVRGRYKSHQQVPAPLNGRSPNSKFVYFLQANAQADTDVLAALPWSAEVEKELTKR